MGSKKQNLGSKKPDLGSKKPDLGCDRFELGLKRPGLRFQGGALHQKNCYMWNPSGAAAQKGFLFFFAKFGQF